MREANTLQGTGAWFNERTGKLTASRMAAAMSFLKAKKDEEPRESSERYKLKVEVLCERLTGDIVPKYVTQEMQWGIDQEPAAKEMFTTHMTGLHDGDWTITDVGFISHPTLENCGASPDGWLKGQNALVEIKCPSSGTMVKWLLAAKDDPNWLPEEYLPQMTLQSACMANIPVWFCAYDPRLPDKQKLLVRLFTPTQEQYDLVNDHAARFLTEVDTMFDNLTKGA